MWVWVFFPIFPSRSFFIYFFFFRCCLFASKIPMRYVSWRWICSTIHILSLSFSLDRSLSHATQYFLFFHFSKLSKWYRRTGEMSIYRFDPNEGRKIELHLFLTCFQTKRMFGRKSSYECIDIVFFFRFPEIWVCRPRFDGVTVSDRMRFALLYKSAHTQQIRAKRKTLEQSFT